MPNTSPSLASRVAAWRHGWILELIAVRAVGAAQAVQERLTLWLWLRSAVVRTLPQARWDEVRANLRKLRGQAIADFFIQDDATSFVDETAAESIARDLSIDLADEWRRLQKNDPKGIQLYEFLDLHRGEEIKALAAAWKMKTRGSRAERIKAIVNQMRDIPLPAAIRPISAR